MRDDERLNVKVGDTVLVTPGTAYRNREPREQVVTRIGRTYAYVTEYGREVAYALNGGHGRSDQSGRMFTVDGWADHQRRHRALTRVEVLTRSYSWARNLSTEQLEAIAAVIEGGDQ